MGSGVWNRPRPSVGVKPSAPCILMPFITRQQQIARHSPGMRLPQRLFRFTAEGSHFSMLPPARVVDYRETSNDRRRVCGGGQGSSLVLPVAPPRGETRKYPPKQLKHLLLSSARLAPIGLSTSRAAIVAKQHSARAPAFPFLTLPAHVYSERQVSLFVSCVLKNQFGKNRRKRNGECHRRKVETSYSFFSCLVTRKRMRVSFVIPSPMGKSGASRGTDCNMSNI